MPWTKHFPLSWVLLLVLCFVTTPWQSSAQNNTRTRPVVKVGAVAPDFTLRDQNGKDVSLRDFRGKKNVVLAFYVFAFTETCGLQLFNLQRNLGRFQAGDTQVLGISMDSMFANYVFAEQLGISFPLLSDWGGGVTRSYGVFSRTYKAPRRMAVFIDKSGKVVEIRLDKEAIDPEPLLVACERRKMKANGK